MAAWPAVVNALLALFPTLTGWPPAESTYDAAPTTAGSDFYVIVGGTLPLPGFEDDTAGSFSRTQDPDGFQTQETGTVRCQLTSASGAIDITGHRGKVFAAADALYAYLAAHRTLGGVLSQNATVDLTVDVTSLQDGTVSDQTLVLTVHYFTVT
jgi:hypothetical protein